MRYAIYYDYTGAGRMPEPVAGPFDEYQIAVTYAEEEGYDVSSVTSKYFIDEYPFEAG